MVDREILKKDLDPCNLVDEDAHIVTSFERIFPLLRPEDQEDLIRKTRGERPIHGGSSIVYRIDLGIIERLPSRS